MCLRRAPEKYIAGAALDRADLDIHSILKSSQKSVFQFDLQLILHKMQSVFK
jgi:hypothetical protein